MSGWLAGDEQRAHLRSLSLFQGLLAGAGAGLAMSVFMMLWDGLAGDGMWTMPQLIGTIVLGADAYQRGQQFLAGPVLVGLTLHTLTSAVMGAAFLLILRLLPVLTRAATGSALLYGGVAGIVAEGWLVPLLSPTMSRHTEPGQMVAGHLVYGLALITALALPATQLEDEDR